MLLINYNRQHILPIFLFSRQRYFLIDIINKKQYNQLCGGDNMSTKKNKIPNKFHLHIQTKYRTLVQESKKHPKRAKQKRDWKKDCE